MYAKFYIPRDERVTLVQIEGLEQEDAIEVASRKMMPALYALYSTQEEYKSLDQVFDLFRKGVTLSNNSKCASDSQPTSKAEEETVVTFRRPKVVAGNTFVPLSNMIDLLMVYSIPQHIESRDGWSVMLHIV